LNSFTEYSKDHKTLFGPSQYHTSLTRDTQHLDGS